MLINGLIFRYFNQANKGVMIQGPKKKYPVQSARDHILEATARNYDEAERRRYLKTKMGITA